MSENVICWLYTYTNDNIDGIIIIKKNSSNEEKYMLYHKIDTNNTNDNIQHIKELIKREELNTTKEYSKQNLQNLINETFTGI
jgi:hypothetical protein